MFRHGRTKCIPITNHLKALSQSRAFFGFSSSWILRQHTASSHRSISTAVKIGPDLFDYTSGRWLYNEKLQKERRRLVFNVLELCRLAADSVGRNAADVIEISKLGEGGFNRAFLITMADQFKMVARVPYPVTVPKFFALASEVATMDFLRSVGLPIPRVYGYSPNSDNTVGTEYIFMEFIEGEELSAVWPRLTEREMVSVVRDLTRVEAKITSIAFPAGGSLYYTCDLDGVSNGAVVTLPENERFCVGPDTSLPLWYGRRGKLDVFRGPYMNAEAALEAPTLKEKAYLEQFGQPLLPVRRERRPTYKLQEQLPSNHSRNLCRYLRIAPFLAPQNPQLSQFRIRHPDFRPGNVLVSRSPDESNWEIKSLLDWQHTAIQPLFLYSNFAGFILHNRERIVTPPIRPDNFNDSRDAERTETEIQYLNRLASYHYLKSMKEFNRSHYSVLMDPLCALRSRLLMHAGRPWEGETLELNVALIEATKDWEQLAGNSVPCPIWFEAEEVRDTMEMEKVQDEADRTFNIFQDMLGIGEEGWVGADRYEEVAAFLKDTRDQALAQELSEIERLELTDHWLFADMDEEPYM